MDVWCICMRLFCVCVVLCLVSGLATCWSLVQGVLPSMKRVPWMGWKIHCKRNFMKPGNETCLHQIDLKGFWRWCMLYRIHRIFLDFFHRPHSPIEISSL
jgi:hypothetical protein